jgi:hypothetical protein
MSTVPPSDLCVELLLTSVLAMLTSAGRLVMAPASRLDPTLCTCKSPWFMPLAACDRRQTRVFHRFEGAAGRMRVGGVGRAQVRLWFKEGTFMSVKSKVFAAATALTVAGGLSMAGALSASAVTPQCSQGGTQTCI